MEKYDVQMALEGVAEARSRWSTAHREFDQGVSKVMSRLLHEAARSMMSAQEVARYSGMTVKRIRTLMKHEGLDTHDGKRLLADRAAKVLAENAEIMGVEPHKMDLMSPLAYLPMGSQMKKAFLETEASRGVKTHWHVEPIETQPDRLYEVYDHDDNFIATFNGEDEATAVCALWNQQ